MCTAPGVLCLRTDMKWCVMGKARLAMAPNHIKTNQNGSYSKAQCCDGQKCTHQPLLPCLATLATQVADLTFWFTKIAVPKMTVTWALRLTQHRACAKGEGERTSADDK